jgi:hypothetical protein
MDGNPNDKTGGKAIIIEGRVEGTPRAKVDDKTGEATLAFQVTYWGGSDYVRVDQSTAEGVKPGSWVKAHCPYVEFNDREAGHVRTFAGTGRIVELDGKPRR